MARNAGVLRWFRDIPISRKLYFTVAIMAVLIGLELFALFFSVKVLSSVRAYVGGEGLWSKAQKNAVLQLYEYGISRSSEDYALFERFMKVPIGDDEARQQLFSPRPDLSLARQGFLMGRNHPDDINGMIWLFRNFRWSTYIAKAIRIWGEAEPIAHKLGEIADKLHEEIGSPHPSQARINHILSSIHPINAQLTSLEDEFSYTLGEGSRWLESVVLRLLFAIAMTVEISGLLLTISVSRSIQTGLKEMLNAARSLADGNYASRANLLSHDEIGSLAESFNMMADRLERSITALQREIAEREHTEEELRAAFALLDQHVNNTPLAVIEWEQDNATGAMPRVRRWSGRAQQIFGWTQNEVVGLSAEQFNLLHTGDMHRMTSAGLDPADGRFRSNSLSVSCRTKEGRVRHCRWYNSSLQSQNNCKIAILSLVEDITEQTAALEDVYRLAHHDTLTGLPNRVLLRHRLEQALVAARQAGRKVAVMVLDLDRFKDVNDTLGHAIGDELLCNVAARLSAALRATDTIARFGGDEFVLVQPDTVDRASARCVAQRVLTALTGPFFIQGNRLHIGASLGLTLFPDDATDPDRLFRNADIALYRAKREGRSQYDCYSPEIDAELRANHSLEVGLRHAIESGALELFYQPVFSLESGRFQAVEALARWPRYRGGFVPPASFIPFAEASGLIVPLGEWALRQACRQARLWNDVGSDLRMSVNVSVTQLHQPDFAELVERVIATTGLVPSALELEITEGVFLDASKPAIVQTLDRIAAMGVHLAIDDFGTGFSSLGYLNRFQFDRIKIDKSFVRGIGTGTSSDAIVKAIIALSRSLGKAVTAEGVETEGQLSFLRQHGCNEVQGFLLAQPVPASEIQCLVPGRNSLPVRLAPTVVPLHPRAA
jgi:diguanylate cyclase (GGDEF)-like protein/PAS domain S-box-containing protein